eukprot:CAMPEP_0176502706 /NCGR_PEP_ID=MMETSP0200_2-20121128/14914_1 /TAXON_ID=947934 /ORGANISM="Chaetoceros sp., Strain GSL56" /LENGTH=421 /DNA_ID=CAMNT_0017901831 /DNA_START=129 /DNA_END=1394 /DNA_ORIENTATION=-
MAALEEKANQEALEQKKQRDAQNAQHPHLSLGSSSSVIATAPLPGSTISDGRILDLEGVTCEPAIQSSPDTPLDPTLSSSASLLDQYTLWNFRCDGATYPARLVNLPCPVEIHKTHDHAMYYKCADVAQMLIVYEDITALEEAESMPGYKHEAFPSYYHSGLTKPMNRVVQRRFLQREHSSVPPPVNEVMEVENYLMELIEKICTKDPTKKVGRGGSGKGSGGGRSMTTKILEEIEDEIVDYEPWMDDYGKAPKGIEFDESDAICKMHPEVWLAPEECKSSPVSVVVADDQVDNSNQTGDKKKKKKTKKKDVVATDNSSNIADIEAESKLMTLVDKKMKKKNKKNKETAATAAVPSASSSAPGSARASVAPSPFDTSLLEPPDISRPSSTPLNLDAMNMDGFDFNLEDLGDDDFDMDAIAD